MRYADEMERAIVDFEEGLATTRLNEVIAENWREMSVRAELVDETVDCFELMTGEVEVIRRPKRWYSVPVKAKWKKMPRAHNEDAEVKKKVG